MSDDQRNDFLTELNVEIKLRSSYNDYFRLLVVAVVFGRDAF